MGFARRQMGHVRRHLSYANVAATLALVFAMSGGALAATHYLINSTKQINPKVLKALKSGTGGSGQNGVNGAPGSSGAAGSQGIQGNQGPAGPAGATGNTGPEGQQGAKGTQGPEGGSVGAWTALANPSKLEQVSGFETVAVRTESAGATARLRGAFVVTDEVNSPSEVLFTLPEGFRPKGKVEFGVGVTHTSGTPLNRVGSLLISPNGAVTDPETPVPPGTIYLFDAVTWNLN
jgi:hypothetical protein